MTTGPPDFGFAPVANQFRGAEGFSLVLDRYELRRGESLVATVMVTDPSAITGTFELGLVCTERWADYHHHARSDMHDHRQTYEEPIYQWWLPLDRNQPRTDLTLPVVPEARSATSAPRCRSCGRSPRATAAPGSTSSTATT